MTNVRVCICIESRVCCVAQNSLEFQPQRNHYQNCYYDNHRWLPNDNNNLLDNVQLSMVLFLLNKHNYTLRNIEILHIYTCSRRIYVCMIVCVRGINFNTVDTFVILAIAKSSFTIQFILTMLLVKFIERWQISTL